MDTTYSIRDNKANHILQRALSVAKDRFGIPNPYPLQLAILADMAERAARTATTARLYCLPTGGGKSLCFHTMAAALGGVSLVLYPLRALIREQATKLKSAGFSVLPLVGGVSSPSPRSVRETLRSGQDLVVLASPESLLRDDLRDILRGVSWSQVVVDEAHVVLGWGTSFRPHLLAALPLIDSLNRGNVHLFTATLTSLDDVTLKELLVFRGLLPSFRESPYRPNLILRWIDPPLRLTALREIMRKGLEGGDACLVFDRSRSGVEILAERLVALGYRQTRFYHAGLSPEERLEIERWFSRPGPKTLVATNAYGMGMDKADIRTLVHWRPPNLVADYLQEIGRAGRDGEDAETYLFLPPKTKGQWYDPRTGCRYAVALEEFGTPPPTDCRCDHCAPTRTVTQAAPVGVQLAWWQRRFGRFLSPSQRVFVLTGRSLKDRRVFDAAPGEAWVGGNSIVEEDLEVHLRDVSRRRARVSPTRPPFPASD